ncbi:MAG: response regulator [Gemmataceae bacterium]
MADLLPAEVHRTTTWHSTLEALTREAFDALLVDLNDVALVDEFRTLHQAGRILAHIPDGIVVVDGDLRIRWTNPAFLRWVEQTDPASVLGREFYAVLGQSTGSGDKDCPFQAALASHGSSKPLEHSCVQVRLQCPQNRHLDVLITVLQNDQTSPLFVAVTHDVTRRVHQQQKLNALHRAVHELASPGGLHLADLDVASRTELLKTNIRRVTHDLLHFDLIEIRLIEEGTGRLVPLLQDGLMTEAVGRELYARPEGNGVTGLVAATGQSYLCADTLVDPHYLPGASGARSSLTVPLRRGNQVVGTFNVESPDVRAFGEEDLQFAEIFSDAVASALLNLELLSAEKSSGANQSIEAVNREVALPVDAILADAAHLLERYVGHNEEMADRIRKILANARQIKQSIVKVGEDFGPPPSSSLRHPPAAVLKGMRVLVADNDDRVRRHAHQLIGRWGGIVETARDGQEALTMARLTAYDVIVADIRLPDLSGYDVFQKLREAQPRARVVLMTGYGYDPSHSLVKAREAGLRQILFKPFRVDQLRDALVPSEK